MIIRCFHDSHIMTNVQAKLFFVLCQDLYKSQQYLHLHSKGIGKTIKVHIWLTAVSKHSLLLLRFPSCVVR